MKRDSEIAIIGAGIGGLSLAAELQLRGVPFQIYEQAEQLGEVGAGIGLWSNATRCLSKIGIDDDFWTKHGCEVHKAEIANPAGRVLSHCDVRPIVAKLEAGSYIVHRADLHRALAEKVSSDSLSLRKSLVNLEAREDRAWLRFSDGSEASATIVVGADGLRSRVRSAVFGNQAPRYAGQTCYRGIADLRVKERHVLREIQGDGPRAAVIPLDDRRVYWWTTENVPEGGVRSSADEKSHLLRLYESWSFGVADAIEATPADAILRNDLYDRPPLTSWSKGPVVLLGDAAHPTTPNLGQGACMAIEDAHVLACLIAECGDPADAFSRYQSVRKARCEAIVKESRRFGWIGGWSSPMAVRLREAMMALTPEFVVRRTLEKNIRPSTPF
ncbi:FAD-dependent monooxygenase [Haloferula chungangensis]|uniref:FAD-dependent monooxygenase n=1 Tax=Haloferula chungangensis TaxID=1048331 RepID=A0ABW2L8D7_9BACT